MEISPIEEIKSRLDIIDLISSYIKLQKCGRNYRALCPFHSEKKPSFFVSQERQIWHCFGCGKGGDIFRFIMDIENVDFGDALKTLAQKAGVELKPLRPELKTERQRLYEICELATKFFEKQLEASKAGQRVKDYLRSRGINEDSIKNWRLGYAPDSWNGLVDFLLKQNYKRDEIEKSGLGVKSEKGELFDRFRGRIMFPIFDFNSQIIGFGGRIFEKEEKEIAKYINTPNTLLYDKSKVLYGLDRARLEIRKKDFCVVVEGYTDVILSHQAGIKNVVSVSGTAFTPYQLKLIKRYTEKLILGFDMDVAGDSATKRGIELAQLEGFNLKILPLPKDKDPADVISENPKNFENLIEKSVSILDFYFQNAFTSFDKNTPEGKKEISKILLPVIKRIPNKIEQAFWVKELAKKLEVKEVDVEEELSKIKLKEEIFGLEKEEIFAAPPKNRRELLEERIIVLLLKKPELAKNIEIDKINLFSPLIKEIAMGIVKEYNSFENKLSAETKEKFNYLALKAEIEEIDEKDLWPEINCCLKEVEILEIKNNLENLEGKIKQAEKEKDLKKLDEYLKEFDDFLKKLSFLQKK